MDFYGNDFVMRAESEYRTADLRRDARRSVADSQPVAGERDGWTRDFADWVIARARIGATFMARHPASS